MNNRIFVLLYLVIFSLITGKVNSQFYVSLMGSDTNSGTIDQPFQTIPKALSKISNIGDTIFVRGGIYEMFSPIKPEKNGLPDNYNKLWAYPGEKPVFDFSSQPLNSAARGIILSRKYWHVKGFEIFGTGDNGIYITGDSNKVENCITYKCRDTGIQISGGGSYNQVINCDSYLNFDTGSKGENADGFAAKLDIGQGNLFRGCRAWSNSDDGWDLYEGGAFVIIDSCWAFRNGYNIWGISGFAGDGNGFKLGGNYIPGNHIITNSVAFHNRGKGFDQNNNNSGVKVYNCTGWKNSRNFSFPRPSFDSIKNELKNNISYDGSNSLESTAIYENNSWQGFSVSADDFASMDTSLATISRNSVMEIPQTDFLRLSPSSQFIDAGTDVGIAYTGLAPDLGAFEYGSIVGVESKNKLLSEFVKLHQNYPNPFNPTTNISYKIDKPGNVKIAIYNSLGEEIKELINKYHTEGFFQLQFSAENLSSGVYFYRLQFNNSIQMKKMLLLQ
ncbi:MAG: right-handed parallel beta-helix repeat-containing protein [Melioribacteraceae bacterium]|nr:right-handed parallel beta-helix repeat-containing protein [Melioribacteraceae bacterium]MCF8265401.1 right-handed parallel beta-helix repeat-containing protein [Melioribacteraceae bacterium]